MRALYEEGIVEEDDLSFLLSRDLAGTLVKVKLEGELRCDLGVRIRVSEVDGRAHNRSGPDGGPFDVLPVSRLAAGAG